VRTTRAALRSDTPLIGFAGAPFTVASYMVEGKGGNLEVPRTKALFRREPAVWDELMRKLTAVTIDYLKAQIEAGAQAIELFDSWAGTLTPAEYERHVLPWSRQIFDALRPTGVPTIHFGVINGGILEPMTAAGSDVVGVDWRTPLDAAWDRIGYDRGIQGNLDPSYLEGSEPALKAGVAEVLERAAGRNGHICNLGHGVNLGVDPGMVRAAVEFVHELGRRN
jgi:uroporphyrinogen decarboxylase